MAYWAVLDDVRTLLCELQGGSSEGDAALMVALDKLTDVIKCGLDFGDKAEELLVLLQLPLELPNVVYHITVLFALCHVLRRTVQMRDAEDILARTHVMESILHALSSQKREVRDAAGQALGAAGVTGARVLLNALAEAPIISSPWETMEGFAMALGYIGGALKTNDEVLEVRRMLFESLVPLLKLVSTENSAMAGNGAVLQHACRSVYWMLKDGLHKKECPDDMAISSAVVSEVENLLSHSALEVRREAAFAVARMHNSIERILDHINEFYELWEKNNGAGATASVLEYLRLHGWILVIRNYSTMEGVDNELLSERVLPFLEKVVDDHIKLVNACDSEQKTKLPSEASFTAGDALRAMANIISASPLDFETKKNLLMQLFERIKKCLASPDTIIVDAALRTVQWLSKSNFNFEAEAGNNLAEVLSELIRSIIIWIFTLQYHPAIVIKVVAVEVLRTMQEKGLYNENFGIRVLPTDGQSKELIQEMAKVVFGYIGESYDLLNTTFSNDLKETILKASLAMLKKLVEAANNLGVNIQQFIEKEMPNRALLEDFAMLILDKTVNGFVGKDDKDTMDFARPSASDCLEIFPCLFGEFSNIVAKLNESEELPPLAFVPNDVSAGVTRLIGILADKYPSKLPGMSFLALMLGIVSPISKTALSTLSTLPALSAVASYNPDVITPTLVDELKHYLIPLSLGDQSELDEYLATYGDDYQFSPLDPFMCTVCLAIFKYSFLLKPEGNGDLANISYVVAITAVLTALTEGSDEFLSKEFAAAILYETDIEALYKANSRWGDVIGLFLDKFADSANDGDVQLELFPDSGEIETTIDSVIEVVGEESITGKYKEVLERFKAMPELNQDLPENEKLVWAIVNKHSVHLENYKIFTSFVSMNDVKCGSDSCATESTVRGSSIRDMDSAIDFVETHKGRLEAPDELKLLSRFLLSEDLDDGEKLRLVPVMLMTNVRAAPDDCRFPCLPLEMKVLDEGKKNEGFASDSQFAAMK